MQKYIRYIKRAKELGAKTAKIIPAKSIIAAEWVRWKCQFGCDGFGKCLTCPPHSPTTEETRRVLKFYKHGLLVHGDEHADIRAIVSKIEKVMFLNGYFKAFGMGAGPCELCETCAESCCHSDIARPSLEACSIDVFTTVRGNGFPIKTLNARTCKGNYYGIILIE